MSIPAYFTSGEAPRLRVRKPSSTTDAPVRLKLEYVNEGGANFVFRILAADVKEDLPASLQGQLLRLRKGLEHVQSAEAQLGAFKEHFEPLFPTEHLIRHELIELDDGLPTAVNAVLRSVERPEDRLRDFAPMNEKHALLITDMTPLEGDMLLQVKPKWLSQSPSAPEGAKRCRTCALRAQRASRNIRTATDAQDICPLKLLSSDEAERRSAARAITENGHLQDYLVNDAQPLLRTLRENQEKLDPVGVLKATAGDEIMNVCKAMTLRDCTLFVKLSGSSIDARLADLDLKQPEKLAQWQRVEQKLIEQGWYDNTEDDGLWKKEEICMLAQR